MSILAQLMYQALVWKERQRARLPAPTPSTGSEAEHLKTGRRGEMLAYWYLRQNGYTIVARNRPARSGAGELDLVGWDGPVLSFVEVKTRTTAYAGPPEAAVSRAKQKRIARAANEYLRRLRRKPVSYRFDVAAVAWDPHAGLQVRLIKDAFKA
ncbi:MAG TPA: YraN family protein [Terriglobia bacterium]|nr:YraN family protein [Terriglobia bacterium]